MLRPNFEAWRLHDRTLIYADRLIREPRLTALAIVVKDALDLAGLTITEVAAEIHMNRSTLASRLNAQSPLELDNARDFELVRKIGSCLGLEPDFFTNLAKTVELRWIEMKGESSYRIEAGPTVHGFVTGASDREAMYGAATSALHKTIRGLLYEGGLEALLNILMDPQVPPEVKESHKAMILQFFEMAAQSPPIPEKPQ
jgi:plasmid maintenance system antidote protein VapI